MSPIVTVYAVFRDDEEAARIARVAVEEGLAACANILPPCRSVYRWQGAVETADEVPALFKTTRDGADALIARIAALHEYDVPAAVAWPVLSAHAPYAEWVRESVR